MRMSHCGIALSTVLCLGAAPTGLHAAIQEQKVVIPNSHQEAWGDGDTLNTLTKGTPASIQLVFDASELAAVSPGDLITAVAWRAANVTQNPFAWPFGSDANWTSYDIYLATSAVAPGNLSTSFAANRGGDFTLVRSGPLTLPVGALSRYTGTPTPGPFEHEIVFDTPFAYGGGHLLLEVRHTGNDHGTFFFLDRGGSGKELHGPLTEDSYTATKGHFRDGSFVTRLTFQSSSTPSCIPFPTVLCIEATPGNARFAATVTFATSQGGGLSGTGQAISLSPLGVRSGGLFSFFDHANPELLVKVLDGCGFNGHFWVFFSAGTNVGFTLKVVDTQENRFWTYVNSDRTPAPPVQDIQAFPCS